jgi:RHS repeat-associated protein
LVFHRDSAGRETGRTIGGVAALSQGFDELGRMTAQAIWTYDHPESGHAADAAHRVLQHRTYTYRPDGTPLEIADHLRGTRRYDLDPTGRVTAVHAAAWTETYAYDVNGNISQASAPSPADEDAQGEREYAGTVIRRAGRTTYEHDAQGRLVRSARRTLSGQTRQWTYAWDADDRLTSVTTPDGTTWQYTYDAIGRRIAKRRLAQDGGTAEEIWFSWDGDHLAEQAVVSTDGRADVLTWDWEPQTHRVAAQTRRSWATGAEQDAIDTAFYAIVTDLIGSPTELVSAADGQIAWQITTSLWGSPIEAGTVGATTPADCPLRFPGQYLDAETGLHYNVLRYYDPATGGYASADPLGLLPAPNHHAYVDNPLTWLDPLGLMGACMSKSSGADIQQEGGFRPQAGHSVKTKYTGKFFNKVPKNVYRMDTRQPAEIANTGFAPRENAAGNLTLWGHVSRTYPDKPGFSRDDSQWISTGRNDMLNDGIIGGMTQTHNLYKIDPSRTGGKFADVNRTFGPDHAYAHQNEYAHEGAIPSQAITHYMTGADARNHLINAISPGGPGRLNLDNLPDNAWTAMP